MVCKYTIGGAHVFYNDNGKEYEWEEYANIH